MYIDIISALTYCLLLLIAARIHRAAAGSMHLSGVCPSVRLSVSTRAYSSKSAAAGLLLWARRAGDIDRLLHSRRSAAAASECEQCHVTGVRRKL